MSNRLEELNRELRFFPSPCDAPRMLTEDQIRFFNEQGYLTSFRIFSEEQAEANRGYFDRLLEQVTREGKDSYSINGYQDRSSGIYDLVKHPVILDYVEDLLGPNFISWGTHYFCKLPGDIKEVSWHQDASYWPLTPSRTVTVWLAIDDVDVENGCMRVIPGSHLKGHIAFRESKESEHNVLNQIVDDAESHGEPVNLELEAGEISLHSDLLLHGSLPNASNRRRCGLTIRYAPASVKAYGGWNSRSILCRGEDPEGNWANIPRPIS